MTVDVEVWKKIDVLYLQIFQIKKRNPRPSLESVDWGSEVGGDYTWYLQRVPLVRLVLSVRLAKIDNPLTVWQCDTSPVVTLVSPERWELILTIISFDLLVTAKTENTAGPYLGRQFAGNNFDDELC